MSQRYASCRLDHGGAASKFGVRVIGLVIGALWLAVASAEPAQSQAGYGELRLQPTLCAVSKEAQLCRQDVLVTWQLSEAASPCLHRADLLAALQCWRQASNGQVQVSIESAQDLVFLLREGEHTLAEAVFRILWEDQQRRRRRKPWQFF